MLACWVESVKDVRVHYLSGEEVITAICHSSMVMIIRTYKSQQFLPNMSSSPGYPNDR
jgi:hypothetical protein